MRKTKKMHETVILKKILAEIKKNAKGKKVLSITLEVGELAHLSAEELRDFLNKTVDFEVFVKALKANVKCECGYEGEPKILAHQHDLMLFECPRCGKLPKILSGEDIVLKRVRTA